jgi:serine kinase
MAQTNQLSTEIKQLLEKEGFTIQDYIDKGSTCAVYKAKLGNEIFAIKIIVLSSQTNLVREKYLPREINIVKSISHEFIIKTHRVIKHEDKYVFIVSDFADGGDLIGILEKGNYLDLNQVRKWFSQIVTAMAYLHSKGIAHRDIKADNVLIHQNNAKLTDFGYARQSIDSNGKVLKSRSMCGTLEYQSPEVLSREEPYDPIISDCFSLGILLYTMITFQFPFGFGPEIRTQKGLVKLRRDIEDENWELPQDFSNDENLFSLLKQLLNPDVYSRIKICQILPHPWFKK